MIQENEVLTFLLAVGCSVFFLLNLSGFKKVPFSSVFLWAFYVLLAGLTFTILEGFFWETFLNFAEHVCYAVSAILLSVWIWLVTRKKEIR